MRFKPDASGMRTMGAAKLTATFNNSIQFNSYLFSCQLNSLMANYKVSTDITKDRVTRTYRQL
jgi:hypothetical protein